MGSTRLPGKVLRSLGEETVLEHQLRRLRASRRIDDVVVATTVRREDDAIVDKCDALDIAVIRGSAHDVLERYRYAAEESDADIVVRVTADCPLIDPGLVDHIIERSAGADYTSNTVERTYPRGLDAEVFSRTVLEIASHEAHEEFEREHVTPFFYRRPERFKCSAVVRCGRSLADWRWTLDESLDAAFFEALFAEVGPRLERDFGHEWLVDYLETRPEIVGINAAVEQKKLNSSDPSLGSAVR
jgi:spore coat polysaccharide biosynthesis protein SpsF